jgi:hypothetical protein
MYRLVALTERNLSQLQGAHVTLSKLPSSENFSAVQVCIVDHTSHASGQIDKQFPNVTYTMFEYAKNSPHSNPPIQMSIRVGKFTCSQVTGCSALVF